jgi:hypothetical protein
MPLRDVRTGRLIQKRGLDRSSYRLGESWFEVSAHTRDDGLWEVCLFHVAKGEAGGGHQAPCWPVLLAHTVPEAEDLTKSVIAFARTLPEEENIYQHNQDGLDTRLRDWAAKRGFYKLNRSTWTRSTE